MRKELIAKKKRMLSRISVKEYRALLSFIEKIYLSEYSLKIILARKCSNLFSALIELVKEEDGGRVQRLYEQKFSKEEEPIVISDRALCYFAQAIRDGQHKRILIVDDVIVHGQTIIRIYEEIEEIAEGQCIDIDVWAYAANVRDMVKKPCIQNAIIEKPVMLHESRVITDNIIDILYLTGQPYTSYIPNIALNKESELGSLIEDFVQHMDKGVCLLNEEEHNYLNLHSYVWIAPENWKFALFQSIRLYIDDDLEQCVVVPMISLLPFREELLIKYEKILNDFILPDCYNKEHFVCGEWRYRAIIYVMSSLWSRFFFRKYLGCDSIERNLESSSEEKVNFGSPILNQEKLNQLSIEEMMTIIKSLEDTYCEVDMNTIRNLNQDFIVLENEVTEILRDDSEKDMSVLIQKFLSINGDLDEWAWKKYDRRQEDVPKRMEGYPIVCLSSQLEQAGENKNIIYMQILKAIDYGRGSIVAKAYKLENEIYFISLLHAGEQNYKYKEMKYFPFLYGLFEIERMAREKGEEAFEYKKKFMKEFLKQVEADYNMQTARYKDTDLQKLCETNITTAFKTVLLKDAWRCIKKDKRDMNISISLADKIMNNED